MSRKTSYPIVGFHGLAGYGDTDLLGKYVPYFGTWNGSAAKTAEKMGLEFYQPNVGGFSGAWDRSCEMWARLKGGTVDYGKVHSEKFGHKRFGRTYKALIPDWGTCDNEGMIKKINLLGHSFGGPAMRMFTQLVVKGSEEEQNGTRDDDLSELFRGGKENWIHSCTSLAGALSGFTLNDIMKPLVPYIEKAGYTLLSYLGQTVFSGIYDPGLYQFGISDEVHQMLPKFSYRGSEIDHLISLKEDNVAYELTLNGAEEMAKNFEAFPGIYYFAHHGCRTHKGSGEVQLPDKNMLTLFKPMGLAEGLYSKNGDCSWRMNDAIVNVPSARYPLNGDPYEPFSGVSECRPGIWYWFPTENKDHLSFNGIGEKSIDDYYRFLFEMICALPPAEKINQRNEKNGL